MNSRVSNIIALSIFVITVSARGQELTSEQKSEFVRQAQPRYYSPIEHGFQSITCEVKLDWDTVPKMVLAPAEQAGRNRLENTKLRFTARVAGNSDMTYEYPSDTPPPIKPVYDKFFEWTSNVMSGFFQTWASKAMRTPIPDVSHITSLTADQNTYQLKFESGIPIEVSLNKEYVITRILSMAPSQTIDEHPQYSPSPQGLLLTGVDATSKTGDDTTHVVYDIKYQTVDTIEFPQAIHLVVNDNLNMKFSLNNCSVVRGTVIKLAPPT